MRPHLLVRTPNGSEARFSASLWVGLLVIAVGSFVSPNSLPADLQAYCESLASRQMASKPLRLLPTKIERTIPLPGDGFMWGAQWNSHNKTLSVFEGTESRLSVLDSVGHIVATIGRRGSGPGEFRLSPVYVGSRQRFRFAEDGRVLALDDRYAHLFTGGRETGEATFEETSVGLTTDVHVARLDSGWLVSMGHRRAPDAFSRSVVQLYLVTDGFRSLQVSQKLGRVRNGLSPAAVSARLVEGPYDDLYRRTWDAANRTLAMVSYRRFAVCSGSIRDSASWRAWSVDATPREVTKAERERVLVRRFGASTGPIPVMGGRIEEYYTDRWPRSAPFYYDLSALNDSTFAALRLDTDGGVTADLIHVKHGYQGSIKVPASRSVIGAYSDGLMLLNFGDAEVELLRAGSGPGRE